MTKYITRTTDISESCLDHSFREIHLQLFKNAKVVVHRCSLKKLFSKISEISHKNNCVAFFFHEVAGLQLPILFFKKTSTQVFSC